MSRWCRPDAECSVCKLKCELRSVLFFTRSVRWLAASRINLLQFSRLAGPRAPFARVSATSALWHHPTWRFSCSLLCPVIVPSTLWGKNCTLFIFSITLSNHVLHCGSKNAPTLADYYYDPVQSILIIFSKLFASDHKSCLVVKFSTSPHICCHYTLWNTMLYFALITLFVAKKFANFGSP